jgi:hypothetical protein
LLFQVIPHHSGELEKCNINQGARMLERMQLQACKRLSVQMANYQMFPRRLLPSA